MRGKGESGRGKAERGEGKAERGEGKGEGGKGKAERGEGKGESGEGKGEGVVAKNELEVRTKQFSLRVIRFVGEFPKNNIGNVLGNQLLRSATSVGANYREANRAESRRDFIHKIGIVEKEAAEALYWLELCNDANVSDGAECRSLLDEANQLVAIFVSIGKNTKARSTLYDRTRKT